MKKTAIFYSFKSVKTRQQVKRLVKAWGNDAIEEIDVDTTSGDVFKQFDQYILAVSTWFDGELPNYWDELIPDLEDLSFKGKRFAIFGGGNQIDYPENFVDGIGLLADFFESRQAKIVGFTSAEGYQFESSKALRGNMFCGLALDIENQAALTHERIDKWVEQIKEEFQKK